MSKDKVNTGGDYEVGYGKPPKEHQFKKDTSGNPKGRPKTKKAGPTDISGFLNEPVRTKSGKKVHNMAPFEASVRQLASKAIGGNLQAIIKFIKLCEEYDAFVVPPPAVGGGVIFAPKGISPQKWVESMMDEAPCDGS